ncbi:hypothetical protein V8E51_015724 [Hyaloscypha variabilis]
MSGSSLIWATYAAGIATLGGISSSTLGKNQRFSIALQNDFAIPVVPYVNQLYQNFEVYRFASVVPEANIAVLTPTGQTYDQAYALYLDNIAFQAPNDPKIEAELNATAAQLTTLRSTIDNLLSTAENDYLNFVINGQDPLTGDSMSFAQYAAVFYPDLQDDINEIAKIEADREELINESIGVAELALVNNWRNALNQGESTNVSYPNYNMGVLQASSEVVIGVSGGTITANGKPTSYDAGFSIGGDFNTVAGHWIETFPSSYPASSTAYDSGKSTYSIQNFTTEQSNWSDFGYSTATASTGSNGWIFWSTQSTETATATITQVSISEKDFGSGFTVSAWGVGTFPVQYGSWYLGNPTINWPNLVTGATPSITENVKQQIESVVIGYGVEIEFTLTDTAYTAFTGAISSAKSAGGSISVFGSLYGKSGSSSTSTFNPWSNIQTIGSSNTVILRAQNAKVPQVLGTIITTLP